MLLNNGVSVLTEANIALEILKLLRNKYKIFFLASLPDNPMFQNNETN